MAEMALGCVQIHRAPDQVCFTDPMRAPLDLDLCTAERIFAPDFHICFLILTTQKTWRSVRDYILRQSTSGFSRTFRALMDFSDHLQQSHRAQELCESRGGPPELS